MSGMIRMRYSNYATFDITPYKTALSSWRRKALWSIEVSPLRKRRENDRNDHSAKIIK